jgi:Acyltransferase family
MRLRNHALNGVRGLAALGVLTPHVWMFTVQGAHGRDEPVSLLTGDLRLGVVLFFVVSGYLLAGPWVASALEDRPTPRLGRFAVKRAARIVPAYWVAMRGSFWLLSGSGHDYEAVAEVAGLGSRGGVRRRVVASPGHRHDRPRRARPAGRARLRGRGGGGGRSSADGAGERGVLAAVALDGRLRPVGLPAVGLHHQVVRREVEVDLEAWVVRGIEDEVPERLWQARLGARRTTPHWRPASSATLATWVGEIDGDYGRGAQPPLEHEALRVDDLPAGVPTLRRA